MSPYNRIMAKTSECRCPVPTCRRLFSNAYNLGKHVKVVHMHVKDFECSVCGRLFGYKHTQRNHMSIHERREGEVAKSIKAGLKCLTALLSID